MQHQMQINSLLKKTAHSGSSDSSMIVFFMFGHQFWGASLWLENVLLIILLLQLQLRVTLSLPSGKRSVEGIIFFASRLHRRHYTVAPLIHFILIREEDHLKTSESCHWQCTFFDHIFSSSYFRHQEICFPFSSFIFSRILRLTCSSARHYYSCLFSSLCPDTLNDSCVTSSSLNYSWHIFVVVFFLLYKNNHNNHQHTTITITFRQKKKTLLAWVCVFLWHLCCRQLFKVHLKCFCCLTFTLLFFIFTDVVFLTFCSLLLLFDEILSPKDRTNKCSRVLLFRWCFDDASSPVECESSVIIFLLFVVTTKLLPNYTLLYCITFDDDASFCCHVESMGCSSHVLLPLFLLLLSLLLLFQHLFISLSCLKEEMYCVLSCLSVFSFSSPVVITSSSWWSSSSCWTPVFLCSPESLLIQLFLINVRYLMTWTVCWVWFCSWQKVSSQNSWERKCDSHFHATSSSSKSLRAKRKCEI